MSKILSQFFFHTSYKKGFILKIFRRPCEKLAVNQWITIVFVEHSLALPVYANYPTHQHTHCSAVGQKNIFYQFSHSVSDLFLRPFIAYFFGIFRCASISGKNGRHRLTEDLNRISHICQILQISQVNNKTEHRTQNKKERKTKHKTQNTQHNTQNTKHKTQN